MISLPKYILISMFELYYIEFNSELHLSYKKIDKISYK